METNETALYILEHVIPATYALLPGKMASTEATAMLLAIGFQESGFEVRRQLPKGPARSFWQIERGGALKAAMEEHTTLHSFSHVIRTLRYPFDGDQLFEALPHNDLLACAIARLTLWRHPSALPRRQEVASAWAQYLGSWHPGKPRQKDWPAAYAEGWRLASGG